MVLIYVQYEKALCCGKMWNNEKLLAFRSVESINSTCILTCKWISSLANITLIYNCAQHSSKYFESLTVKTLLVLYCVQFISLFRLASEGNRAVITKVVESIYSDYGGKEQCPWSFEQLKGILNCEISVCLSIILCWRHRNVSSHYGNQLQWELRNLSFIGYLKKKKKHITFYKQGCCKGHLPAHFTGWKRNLKF